MQGNCNDCVKINTCKKDIGIMFGFCNTDFEPRPINAITFDANKVLDRLTPLTKSYIQICKEKIELGFSKDDQLLFDEYNHKLLGSLDTLACCEIITKDEANYLYNFYTDEYTVREWGDAND